MKKERKKENLLNINQLQKLQSNFSGNKYIQSNYIFILTYLYTILAYNLKTYI